MEALPLDIPRELSEELTKVPERYSGLTDIFARGASRWGLRKLMQEEWHQAIDAYSTAIRLDPNHGEYYVGRSRANLRLTREREAAEDLAQALERGAVISNMAALEFVKWGDEESARSAVLRSVEGYKDAYGRAGALENLGLYYIRTVEWQKAFDHTNEVLKLSDKMAWNWLIRAIAARQLGLVEEERRAFDDWSRTKADNDLEALKPYIDKEINEFFRPRSRSK